jgi:hypothetical protein
LDIVWQNTFSVIQKGRKKEGRKKEERKEGRKETKVKEKWKK